MPDSQSDGDEDLEALEAQLALLESLTGVEGEVKLGILLLACSKPRAYAWRDKAPSITIIAYAYGNEIADSGSSIAHRACPIRSKQLPRNHKNMNVLQEQTSMPLMNTSGLRWQTWEHPSQILRPQRRQTGLNWGRYKFLARNQLTGNAKFD